MITLRKTVPSDLHVLFVFQNEEEGKHLAAFVSDDYADKDLYLTKFTGLLENPTVNMQTILYGDTIAGSVVKFMMFDEAEISYWIGADFWNKGLATFAVREFLKLEPMRPLFGRTAFDNIGSQRVLEKNGFKRVGEDKGFANARKKEITEFIYKLG